MATQRRSTAPHSGEPSNFELDIRAGLSTREKSIPCQYFYDAAGSALFEQITELPEYYPARTEVAILNSCAGDIAARTREGAVLVEFGSGSSVKTGILLAACPMIGRYVPIDVSDTALAGAKVRLEALFPQLKVEPVFADFSAGVELPLDVRSLPKLGFFPGSTIGNFSHEAAVRLLSGFRKMLGSGSRLIVGADLRKSPELLIPAYNDAAGVTAAFNLNLLVRVNRELGANFDVSKFEHLATYTALTGRIDMYLVSKSAQTAMIGGQEFQFANGERIHTEISQKYDIAEMQGLAERAGWISRAVWTDAANLFSVHEFDCG